MKNKILIFLLLYFFVLLLFLYVLFVAEGYHFDYWSQDFEESAKTRELILDFEAQTNQELEEKQYLVQTISSYENQLRDQAKKEPVITPKEDVIAPSDIIEEDQIQIRNSYIKIHMENAEKWFVLDTKSMVPVIDSNATLLAVKPATVQELQTGDIILFNTNISEITFVHRIINVSEDEQGIFFTTKGDNNPKDDGIKVRFTDVEALVAGIIY